MIKYVRQNYKRINSNKNDDHITSGGVLAWTKKVEAQWVQAAVLNTLIELRQFHKNKTVQKSKRKQSKNTNAPECTMTTMQIL